MNPMYRLSMITALAVVAPFSFANAASCLEDLTKNSGGEALLSCLKEMQAEIDELRERTPVLAGAVVAFDLDKGCPAGWTEYEDARGRMILGANGNGTFGYVKRPFRGVGGEETVTLNKSQLPPHEHLVGEYVGSGDNPDIGKGKHVYVTPPGSLGEKGLSHYNTVGNKPPNILDGLPHNNMPPYLALYFCIR